MMNINYPEPDFKFKEEAGKKFIYDIVRKQWFQITEEEWVRQNFIRVLIHQKKYPVSLFAVEKEMKLGELSKRFDILVYDRNHKPWMMIECKAPEIKLTEKVIEQILSYHISIPCEYLIITNGKDTFGWHKQNAEMKLIEELPIWA